MEIDDEVQEVVTDVLPNEAPQTQTRLRQDNIDKIEYRKISGNSSINAFFELKVQNGQPTVFRRCMSCKTEIKCSNANTTGLHKHRLVCLKRPAAMLDNEVLSFAKSSRKDVVSKGLNRVAKLVYEDSIPITKVAKSETLQSFYQQLGFDKVSYYSINRALNIQYQSAVNRVKDVLRKRNKMDLLCISFDKWTSADMKRFLGVYLYAANQSICLGMIPYRGFCGGEESLGYLKKLLETFGLVPDDIKMCVVDCGSDVQLASRLAQWFTFPCLCHVINLIARKLILTENELLSQEDSDSEFAPADDEEATDVVNLIDDMEDYVSVVRQASDICRKIHRSTRLQEKLQDAQRLKGLPTLGVRIENITRWNSLLSMLERFMQLKVPLLYIMEDDLDNFEWHKLERIVDILAPLRDASVDLQCGNVGAKDAVHVLGFLNNLAATEAAMSSVIRDVTGKWIENNSIANALLYQRGDFYQFAKRALTTPISHQQPSDEHGYVSSGRISYKEWKSEPSRNNFDIIGRLPNFKPCSVDVERLFSLGRLSKNYLQNRLSADNHNRNVFLSKNSSLIK